MAAELQIFNHPQFGAVRTVEINGEPWFVGKDVAQALGYTNPQKAVRDHVDEDDLTVNESFTVNGTMGTLINESGVYSLVFGSKLESAKEFKRWVTSEVLPSIRKHGAYLTPQVTNQILNNPDFLISLANKIKEEQTRNRILMEENTDLRTRNEELKPKALFAESVAASSSEITVGTLAKLLRQNGVKIGRNRLFEFLRAEGYLIRDGARDRNLPTQKSMELGLFRVKETTIHANDEIIVSCTPYVTGKGQTYFIDRFLNGAAKA